MGNILCEYEGRTYGNLSEICSPAKENGYILLAIETDNVRKIILGLLTKSEVLAFATNSGQEALEVLKDPLLAQGKLKAKIKGCLCAILEEKEGGATGISLLQEIRAHKDLESLLVIIISPGGESGDVAHASEAGTNAFITIAEGLVPKTIERKLIKVVNDRADPPQYVKLIKAGESCLEQNNLDKALECFKAGLAAYEKMAVAKIEAMALDAMKKAVHVAPDKKANAERAIVKGKEHLERNEYGKAIEKFEQALEYLSNTVKLREFQSNKSASMSRILILMGKTNELKGEMKEAEKFYGLAVDTNPISLKACLQMVQVCEKQGKNENVVIYLKQVNHINPHNPERQQRLGELCLKSGDTEEAKKAFQMAIQENPARIRQVSKLCLNAENTTLASFFLDLAVKKSKGKDADTDFVQDIVDQYNELGRQLRQEEKFSQAIVEYDRAQTVAPEDARIIFNKGRAFYDWGKTERSKEGEAQKWFVRAAEIFLKKGEEDKELEEGLEIYLQKFHRSLESMRKG